MIKQYPFNSLGCLNVIIFHKKDAFYWFNNDISRMYNGWTLGINEKIL